MIPVQLNDDSYWVGAIDWNVRNFHGYLTQRGTTYNSYIILDEKITLIDTVKPNFMDEMKFRISEIVNPEKIDYVISNHVEMDHSGGLPEIMDIAKSATVITSPNGEKGLIKHYGNKWNFKVVNTGDKVNIGKRSLNFILTPMVHWPDNMVVYSDYDKTLYSNDAFGQHIATSERFDSNFSYDIMIDEAKKYYANIVLPYSSQVKKALESAGSLDINTIAPSHGLIWKDNVGKIIDNYSKWSTNKTENRALIIYDTMWNSTEKIAFSIKRAFEKKNISAQMINLKYNHISDIMTGLLTSKYICIGSPTLNMNPLPTVAAFLSYFSGLAPKERIGLAFGSYGWGPKGVDIIEETFNKCKFELLDSIRIQYIPDEEQLTEITESVEKAIS